MEWTDKKRSVTCRQHIWHMRAGHQVREGVENGRDDASRCCSTGRHRGVTAVTATAYRSTALYCTRINSAGALLAIRLLSDVFPQYIRRPSVSISTVAYSTGIPVCTEDCKDKITTDYSLKYR